MYLVFFVDVTCLAAAPLSDDVILMCESAKVSGTVTSHASGLPFDHGIKVAPSERLPPCVMRPGFLVYRNLCPFDCSPDGMTLMSGGTFPAREAVKSSGVDQLATYTGVR